jgi:hypothetical protein
MRRASYSVTALPSAGPVASGRVPKRIRIFFSFIVDALHESRRRQAQRVLHQYRHLIARALESMVHDPKSKERRS